MARKTSMKSLRRNLIQEIYNSAPMPEPQADYSPSFNSGMSRDEIANIYNSYEPKNQDIPKLEQNTTPIPAPSTSTPSISDELERMRKAKADTTTPRTEGEQKAIDTYYNSLVDATKSAPKQSTPKQTTPDYRAEIQRMNQLKADTTAPRTEGENQAIDTYLAGLEEAQRYLDSQTKTTVKKTSPISKKTVVEKPKKNIGTVEVKSDGTRKYTKTMSANEQRDYERALMAQSKARGRALSSNEQRDYERAQEAIAKAKEREKVTTEAQSVSAPVSAKSNTENITYGRIKQEEALPTPENRNENAYTLVFDEEHPDGYEVPVYAFEDEKEARKNDFMNQTGMSNAMANPQNSVLNNLNSYDQLQHAALAGAYYGESEDKKIDRYLNTNTRLTKKERQDAKKIVKNYYKENPKAKKLRDTNNANVASGLRSLMSREEFEEYSKMIALENKAKPSASAAMGVLDIPLLESAANKMAEWTGVPEEYNWTAMKENAQRQNPLLYTGGNAARIIAEYGALSPYLESIPALANFTNGLGTAAAGGDAIIGSKIGSVLRGTLADAVLSTVPREINNVVNNGYGVADVAADAFEDLTENALWNMVPEFGPDVIRKAKNGSGYNVENEPIAKLTNPSPVNEGDVVKNGSLLTDDFSVTERMAKNGDKTYKFTDLFENDALKSLNKDGLIDRTLELNQNIKRHIDGEIKPKEVLESEIKNFNQQIRNYHGNKMSSNALFDCCTTPSVLKENGVKGNKIMMEQSVYKKLAMPEGYPDGKHGFGKVGVEKIIRGLDDPALIMDDLDDVLVVVNYTSKSGKPVYAVLTVGNDGVIKEVNEIADASKVKSAYVNRDLPEKISNNPQNVRYIKGEDEVLSNSLNTALKSSSPADSLSTSSLDKIDESVNSIPGNKVSLNQTGRNTDDLITRLNEPQTPVPDEITRVEAPQPEAKPGVPQEPKGRDIPDEYKLTQSPEERARQDAEEVSQKVMPVELANADVKGQREYIKDFLKNIEMPKELRVELDGKLKNLDEIMNKFNNATSKKEIMESMDELEKLYGDVEDSLKGNAKVVVRDDSGIKESKNAFKNAMSGRTINLSANAAAGLTDTKLKEINNLLYSGPNSGRFVKNGGAPLDSVFDEINSQTGNALSNYMESVGLNPDVMEDQAQGIVEYARYLKGQKGKVIREDAYEGGLLDDVFQHMIDKAGERGFNIEENELRKNKYISAFRTNKQGSFGMTDEELNNKYFNTQNEHFQEVKGNRGQDAVNAARNLETDYDGTVNKILEKPLDQFLTPQEFDEGMMAFNKEMNDARAAENGDYSKAANIFYRLQQDRHDAGAALQASAAWKANTPAGVLMDALDVTRKMGEEKFSQEYMQDLDKLVRKISKVANNDSLSFEEQARQIRQFMAELQYNTGYSNGVDGFKQMKEALETGKLNRQAVYEDLKKAGRIVTEKDFEDMLKTGKVNRIVEDLNKVGRSVTVEDFYDMLKTGKLTKNMVMEDLKKAGKIVTMEDFNEMLKTGKLNREMVLEDLNKVGRSVTMDDVNKMLDSCKPLDEVSIKDIIYGASKVPNLDAKAQAEIFSLAQEMYSKELTDAQRQKYYNKINMILSSQKNWTIKDKAVELAHIMMLSGPKTHEKNFLANVGVLPYEGISRKISAGEQFLYHLVHPEYKPTQSFHIGKDARKLARQYYDKMGGADAIVEGVADKFASGKRDLIGPNYMFGTKRGLGKKNIVAKTNDALTSIPVLGKGLEKAENKLGDLANAGLKKMGAEGAFDAMDSELSLLENYRQGVYGALSGLEDNPFVRENFENRLASYIQARGIKNIDDIPEEAYRIARNEALKATFKDDNAVTELFQKIKGVPGAGEVLLPFTKTPANLLNRSIDYSPVGLARSLYGALNKNSKFHQDTIGEAFDEIAKGLTGSLASAVGIFLYENGVITGSKDPDADIANYMMNQLGWYPYSISGKGLEDFINKKLGTNIDLPDNYVSYDWLQPSTTNLVASTELWDAIKNGKEMTAEGIDGVFDKAKSIADSYASTMMDQSTFQSISDLFDTSKGQGVGANFIDTVVSLPTRYTSGAWSDIAKLGDNTVRETYSKGHPISTLENKLMSKTVGLSDNLPAKYDYFGQEIQRNPSQEWNVINTLFNPSTTTFGKHNQYTDFIDAVNNASTSGNYTPDDIAWAIKLDDETKHNLTNVEHSQASQISGQTRASILDEVMQNEAFNSLSENTKVDVLKKLDKVATNVGYQSVIPNVKISDDDQKVLDSYSSNTIQQFVTDISKNTAYKSALKETGLSDSDANQAAFEDSGVEGLNAQAEKRQKAVDLGFVNKDGSVNVNKYTDAYDVMGDDAGVEKYKSIADDIDKKGYSKQADYIPYVLDMPLTTVEKGKILYLEGKPKADSSAEKAYDKYGYAGLSEFRQLQYLSKDYPSKNHPKGDGKIDTYDRIQQLYEWGYNDKTDEFNFYINSGLDYSK